MNLARPAYWTEKSISSLSLWPLSLMFRLLVWIRRLVFQSGLMQSWRSPVPVVVVGNITVGGAGKTPLVIALSKLLADYDYNVGVVTRGYGGTVDTSGAKPMSVTVESNSSIVGDEALLIAKRTGQPVVVCGNRVAAVQHLIAQHNIDCVLCDDGLQHYALERDVEIVVVDAAYGFGNGFCLPAGPLREPVSRLAKADFVVCSGSAEADVEQSGVCQAAAGYQLVGSELVDIADETNRQPLEDLAGTTVHAVAGIASPDNFFELLHGSGIKTIKHAFGDHAVFSKSDLEFTDDLPVLMTEKDMVKCKKLGLQNAWYVPVFACLDDEFESRIRSHIEQVISEKRNHAD